MALSRDIGYTMIAFSERMIHTSAAATAGSGSAIFADTCAFNEGITGRVIDRLSAEFGDRMYRTAELAGHLYSSIGSTNANRRMSLAVKLQHGDSSAGGDLADLSTGAATTGFVFFSCARSTETLVFSSSPFYGQTPPNYYDLTRAKRYVAAVVTADLGYITTETCGDNYSKVSATVRFAGADELPWTQHVGIGSTVTASA